MNKIVELHYWDPLKSVMAMRCNYREPRLTTEAAISNLHSLVRILVCTFQHTIDASDLKIIFLETMNFVVPMRQGPSIDGAPARKYPWLFVTAQPATFELFKTDMSESVVVTRAKSAASKADKAAEVVAKRSVTKKARKANAPAPGPDAADAATVAATDAADRVAQLTAEVTNVCAGLSDDESESECDDDDDDATMKPAIETPSTKSPTTRAKYWLEICMEMINDAMGQGQNASRTLPHDSRTKDAFDQTKRTLISLCLEFCLAGSIVVNSEVLDDFSVVADKVEYFGGQSLDSLFAGAEVEGPAPITISDKQSVPVKVTPAVSVQQELLSAGAAAGAGTLAPTELRKTSEETLATFADRRCTGSRCGLPPVHPLGDACTRASSEPQHYDEGMGHHSHQTRRVLISSCSL